MRYDGNYIIRELSENVISIGSQHILPEMELRKSSLVHINPMMSLS